MSKIIPPQTRASLTHKDMNGDVVKDICENSLHVVDVSNNVLVKEIVKKEEPKKKPKLKTIIKRTEKEEKLLHDNGINKKGDQLHQLIENMNNDKNDRRIKLRRKSSNIVKAKEKIIKNKVISSKKPKYIHEKPITNKKVKNNIPKDPLLSRFEKATDSIKQRCNMLSKKVEDFLSYKKTRKQKIVVNETVQFSNIIKDNKNVSVRKKIEEIVLHDYVPLPPSYSPCSFDNRMWDGLKKKSYKSSYDLVKTILKTQQTIDHIGENVTQEQIATSVKINTSPPLSYSACSSDVDRYSKIPLLPMLTYDSHINRLNHFNVRDTVVNNINKHFITTKSKDNFVMPCNKQNTRKRYKTNVRKTIDFKHKKLKETKKSIFDVEYTRDFPQESVTIDFSTKSNDYLFRNSGNLFTKTNEESILIDRHCSSDHLTYTYKEQNCHVHLPHKYKKLDETYILDSDHTIPNDNNHRNDEDSQENSDIFRSDRSYTKRSIVQRSRKPVHTKDNVNVVFVSESQEFVKQGTSEINVEPLEICEVVHSQDVEILGNSIQKNDSLFNNEFGLDSFLFDKDAFISAPRNTNIVNIKSIKNASLHFYNQQTAVKIATACSKEKNIGNTTNPLQIFDVGGHNFNFRNRLRFVPKGT